MAIRSAILFSTLTLTACAQFPGLNSSDHPRDSARFASELSERYGYAVKADEQTAHSLLAELANESNLRYSSPAPRDVAELGLKYITLSSNDGHDYSMRDVNLNISRGDSRVIRTSDVQHRFSGIEIDLRVTYSVNGKLWINGKEVGYYIPGEDNYLDARAEDLSGQGTVFLRAFY